MIINCFPFHSPFFTVQSLKESSVGLSSSSSFSVSSQCLSSAALLEISAWASHMMRWVHVVQWPRVSFQSEPHVWPLCALFLPVCTAHRCTSSHLLHDLPWFCRWCAQPPVETQALASHHGFLATAHGLFYQLWQHCHSGAQALQSTARTTLGFGWVVWLSAVLCLDSLLWSLPLNGVSSFLLQASCTMSTWECLLYSAQTPSTS